ncbi:MAG: polymerase subunit delta [Solirubrobacteraceae bacterium]|nr:polymerase subunit delta [Solirubrobacteraceae bacterium]
MLAGTERHPHARAVLSAALPPDGRPSHAYLFHGPAGAGKRAAARAFAAELLAEGAADPDNARERVHHGVHPDLTWVTPSGAADMLVSDIDEPVIAAASHTPFEARRRVFVIERAETMNEQAQNKMLKTLEEPASFAHLVLLTSRPGQLLPTIASRCQAVRFDPPPVTEIATALQGVGIAPAEADAAARLGLGDAERAARVPVLRGHAEAFARAALRDDLRDRPWLELLARAKQEGDLAQATVEERVASEQDLLPSRERKRAEREGGEAAKRAQRRARTAALDHALELAGLWFRDVACVADGAPEVVHATDRLGELEADAEGRSSHALRRAVALVDDARAALILNPSEELLLEALASRLAREVS